MRFKVVEPRRTIAHTAQPTFVLAQDNWNDFDFQTLYHLHFVSAKESVNIGAVKILKKGQTAKDGLQITEDFDDLGPEYVAVGQSLDYYQHLAELGEERRDAVLKALHDVAKFPELEKAFSEEEGWGTSLFRDQSQDVIRDFLILARSLLQGDYTSLPDEDLKFTFHMSGWVDSLELNFSSGRDVFHNWGTKNTDLPERVIVLIGRNGSGKSLFLARLARVAHGTATNRRNGLFDDIGSIVPVGIGFPRIITVSYSAFDSFSLPGVPPQRPDEPDERVQLIQDARRGEGRYIFCGLRDIASELEAQIKDDESAGSDGKPASDLVKRTLLKSVESLAAEFEQTLHRIKRLGREREFDRAMSTVATDPAFAFWTDDSDLDALMAEATPSFLAWSTGRKIVAQIIASLVAHITPRSLVLIDEPEMHLHPPLLAALMHAVRYLLEKNKAFAIVATHSPVVVQESLTRHVYIARREADATAFLQPRIETFGENVGALTSEVFGLNSEVTDYHTILDDLVSEYESLQPIEALFGPSGLSLQARAYVLSRLAERDAE